tara:strand:+ start:542 stop:829 length:288 start_codon:yes stop_codon:yes gene_type:complete
MSLKLGIDFDLIKRLRKIQMNPQILFNFTIVFFTAGLILLLKGIFILGFVSLFIAIGTSVIWLMNGFFEKFEYKSPETKIEDDKDEEGKGVLKPF